MSIYALSTFANKTYICTLIFILVLIIFNYLQFATWSGLENLSKQLLAVIDYAGPNKYIADVLNLSTVDYRLMSPIL